jgi:hypothetical protein
MDTINHTCIQWVQKLNECLEVCTKSTECTGVNDTHRICKTMSPDSYRYLNQYFQTNLNTIN